MSIVCGGELDMSNAAFMPAAIFEASSPCKNSLCLETRA